MNKSFLYNILLASLFLLAILFISCDDAITNNHIDDVVIPSSNVSYAQYIQPVFNVKCTSSGCHDNESMAGGYSLTTWSSARIAGIVEPFTVETSRMVWRIDGLGFPIMPPPTKGYLTANQREGIKTWIKEGAQNN